jgi:hypothetical protein
MTRLTSIGMIALAIGCSEPNPLAMGDTSSGGTEDPTTSMTTTVDPTMTTSTTVDPTTTTMSTTDDPTTETTDDPTTGSVDTSTGAAACDESTSRCVPEVPEGWEGPVALRYSDGADEDPGCAAPYEEVGVVAFATFFEGAHDCGCDCGAPENVSCSDVTLVGDNTAGCGSPLGSTSVGEDCTNLPVSLEIAGTSYWRATATIDAGSCDAQPQASIGPAGFETRITLCGGGVGPGECAVGETCTPLPGDEHDGRICIWQLGDVACPAEWTDHSVLYEDFDDTRGCTPCTCGEVTGDCMGTVGIGTEADCVGGQAVASITVNGNCQQGASALQAGGASINGSLTVSNAACDPSDSTETGTISTTGPVTQCCLPPD